MPPNASHPFLVKTFWITKTKPMPDLPEDIIDEILLRLPAKFLVRFKCVCKSWKTRISASFFVKKHLNLSIKNHWVLFKYDRIYTHIGIYSEGRRGDLDLDPPFDPCILDWLMLVGSCNGILCLSTNLTKRNPTVYLWNPAINEYRTLTISCSAQSTVLGFGFNPKSENLDDFKVVKANISVVEIYSLRTNCWKELSNSLRSGIGEIEGRQVVLNGSVYWCTKGRGCVNWLIVFFDMADEVFREMALPDCMNSNEKPEIDVGVLEGCLSLFARNKVGEYEVWVMKEYGVVESWSRNYVISGTENMGMMYKPLEFTRDAKVTLSRRPIGEKFEELISYDPKSKRLENLGVPKLDPDACQACTYVESLIRVAVET